jgi:hypothetical protein
MNLAITKQEQIILIELLSDYVKDTEDEKRLNTTAKHLLEKLEQAN